MKGIFFLFGPVLRLRGGGSVFSISTHSVRIISLIFFLLSGSTHWGDSYIFVYGVLYIHMSPGWSRKEIYLRAKGMKYGRQ